MELLNSSWLIHLIEGTGRKPREKLLSIYSILDTWLKAPNVRESLIKEGALEKPIEGCKSLEAHLMALAVQGRLKDPYSVITQLMILLQAAVAEELRNPGLGALNFAQQAAEVVLKQAEPNYISKIDNLIKSSGYAASVIAISVLTLHFWPDNSTSLRSYSSPSVGTQYTIVSLVDSELLEKASEFRWNMVSGKCPTPNFFSIPKDQFATYVGVIESNITYESEASKKNLASFLAWYNQNRAWECFSNTEEKQKYILGMGI
jgi:hypothetical protein